MRARAVSVVLALGACAPAAEAPKKPIAEEAFVLDSKDDPAAAAQASAGAQSLREASIQYLPGRVRFPAVRGSVRGKSTWMLVDTGASRNFVSDWLVHRIFEDDVGASASDHAGRKITTTFMERPRMQIDGWGSMPDDSAMILHDASRAESDDVGVTMSPQTLAKAGVVVLDFLHKRLAMTHTRSDADAMLPHGGALATAQYCRGIYILPAKLGDATARLMVDTGAYATDLHPRSQAAKALAFHAQDGQGASMGAGGAIAYHRLPHVNVSSGTMTANVDVMLLDDVNEDDYCPFDGVLGMDVLEKCTLVIDDKTMTGRCAN